MKTGIELIAEERNRQMEKLGWSAENDDRWVNGELVDAALVYLPIPIVRDWPWSGSRPSLRDQKSNLVKAGALISAELDRLNRKENKDFVRDIK